MHRVITVLTLALALPLVVLGRSGSPAIAQESGGGSSAARRLLTVGDSVDASGRVSLNTYPGVRFGDTAALSYVDLDRPSTIEGLLDDGSILALDQSLSTLFQIGAGAGRSLLDPTHRDPKGDVALSRILSARMARNGDVVLVANLVDGAIRVFSLTKGRLVSMSLSKIPTGAAFRRVDAGKPISSTNPLIAIGDSGQVAFTASAHIPSTVPGPDISLFQTIGGVPRRLLRTGQSVDGVKMEVFFSLESNGAGDLAIWAEGTEGGAAEFVVLRKTSAGLRVVAKSGRAVPGFLGTLDFMSEPYINANGTILFRGGEYNGFNQDPFVNYFVDGPGRPLQPLLPAGKWQEPLFPKTYAISDTGTIAICASANPSGVNASLFLIDPEGQRRVIADGNAPLKPLGALTFGPAGELYFLALDSSRTSYGTSSTDSILKSSLGVGLFCYREGNPLQAVALTGQLVPRTTDQHLFGILPSPATSAGGVAFLGLFEDPTKNGTPLAGLFRIPPGKTLGSDTFVAKEGDPLSDASAVTQFNHVAAEPASGFFFEGLLPGSGQVAALLPAIPQITKPHVASQSAAPTAKIPTLLAVGDELKGIGGSRFQIRSFRGHLTPFGSQEHLVVARVSPSGTSGTPQDQIPEELFTFQSHGQQRTPTGSLMRAGPPPPSLTGALLGWSIAGFGRGGSGDGDLPPPSTSADGQNVVFMARLTQDQQPDSFAVFFYRPDLDDPLLIAHSMPAPGSPLLLPGDHLPYTLSHWTAVNSGQAYLLVQPSGGEARLGRFTPGDAASNTSPTWEVVVQPGKSATADPSHSLLQHLDDYIVDGAGTVYVSGATAAHHGLFRVTAGAGGQGFVLQPLVLDGAPVPAPQDPTQSLSYPQFTGEIQFLPTSARGALLFHAGVGPVPADAPSPPRGLFRLNAKGEVETLVVDELNATGSRALTYRRLADGSAVQTATGYEAYATDVGATGRPKWIIWRVQLLDAKGNPVFKTVPVVEDGQTLADGGTIFSLDPSAYLNLPPNHGPVFSLNESGDVAFLAFDGQTWSICGYSDHP